MINFIVKVVKKVYKKEPSTDIIQELCEEVERILRTPSFNKQTKNRLLRNARQQMNNDIIFKVKNNQVKGQENLDMMMEMMKLRSGLKNNYLSKQRKYFYNTSYRPYQVRNAPLQAKDNNSVLLSSILPVVKNKKIVDYRIQSKKTKWKRVRLDKRRMNSMINEDFQKIREKQNNSTRF